MLTELQGQIERITYTNEDNGFTIAKIKVQGRKDLVTVVGTLLAPMPGEIIKTKGGVDASSEIRRAVQGRAVQIDGSSVCIWH